MRFPRSIAVGDHQFTVHVNLGSADDGNKTRCGGVQLPPFHLITLRILDDGNVRFDSMELGELSQNTGAKAIRSVWDKDNDWAGLVQMDRMRSARV
jgi:hypothetical protein